MSNIYYHDPLATGLNDGTSWVDAYTSPHAAMSGMISGDITYAKGTYTPTIAFTSVNNGTALQPIKFIGCDDIGTPYAGQYTIIGSGLNNCYNYSHSFIWFENVTFTQAKSHNVTRSAGGTNVFNHCAFTSSSVNGINTTTSNIYIDCVFRNNSNTGANALGTFISCVFAGNSAYGISTSTTPYLIDCLAYDNGDDNFRINSAAAFLFHSVGAFSTSGSATWIQGSGQTIMKYNAFTNCPGYGIENLNILTNNNVYEDYNGFYNNTSGNLLNTTSGLNSITFSASPYIDVATDNYSTSDTADKRRTAINLEWA